MVEEMLARLMAGEVRALARVISIVERGGVEAEALVAGCRRIAERQNVVRIGVTGAPGVGKSTVVDQMVRVLRAGGETVGVVAVDATSPVTGGAVLGDRIRMRGFAGDSGVFVRSLASRGALGGVGRGVEEVCLVMEAAGKSVVIVETVGVGQDEVAVHDVVDVVVLIVVAGMGDDVQSMKAGILEVADVFVVNKADRGGAEGMEADLVGMEGLSGGEARPVVRTVGLTGEGVGELVGVIRGVARRKSVVNRGELAGKKMVFCGENVVLDHVAVAVRSLEGVGGFYEGLGLVGDGVEVVEHEGVRVRMFGVGESRIELLEALGEETTIGRFVAKRGEGLHHVALRVRGLDRVCEEMAGRGVRLVGDGVRVGAGGHRYRFVHPESTGGVLVELVEVAG